MDNTVYEELQVLIISSNVISYFYFTRFILIWFSYILVYFYLVSKLFTRSVKKSQEFVSRKTDGACWSYRWMMTTRVQYHVSKWRFTTIYDYWALPDLKCVGSKLFKRNVKKSQGFLSRKKHAAINMELKMDNACKGSRPC